ncbi:WXG100 family type VII secretion target [Paenibacillus amylolyticus]|uniref:WXG100 family type VII secretion target n=1 Tax=Paenibacillus amylolyticus TaxID=1451 RepID=UPI000B88C745|nr:WXG100 family type VII secretion target [Paenibacillus amylolyticus]
MTKIQIPVDQMTHTIGVFKVGHGHLQQTLARLNSQLTPLLDGFEGETAERFAHLYRYAEKNLNTTLELLHTISLRLEQIRERFVDTDSTMVNISALLQYQANPGTPRTNDLVCGPNDPPPKRSVEEHVDAFFNQAGENILAIGDSALQLGKDLIEHPVDTAGNFLYDNTIGTIKDVGNGIAFSWNYVWDNGDTREQAEKQIAAEFDKMKQEGGAEYAANITTSMLLGIFGRKVGIKSIDGKQHHSPHTDSGGGDNKKADQNKNEQHVQYGEDFGKMGTYVENPSIQVNWSEFAEHGFSRMEKRGVTQDMVDDWVKNGKALSQNEGVKYAFITREGVAVVSKEGKLVTTWGKDNFDEGMTEIVEKIYGK